MHFAVRCDALPPFGSSSSFRTVHSAQSLGGSVREAVQVVVRWWSLGRHWLLRGIGDHGRSLVRTDDPGNRDASSLNDSQVELLGDVGDGNEGRDDHPALR